MGLFGGGNTDYEITNKVKDERLNSSFNRVGGPAVAAGKGDVTLDLSFTDQGAVQAAHDLSTNAVRAVHDTGTKALAFGTQSLGFADKQNERAFNFARRVQGQASESQRASTKAVVRSQENAVGAVERANQSETAKTLEQVIKYGGLAALGLVAVAIFRG